MTDLSKITVRKKDIVMRHCDACGTSTAHIGKQDGTRNGSPFSLCLQCFVDVNDVKEWSRWLDPYTGNRLTEPRANGGAGGIAS